MGVQEKVQVPTRGVQPAKQEAVNGKAGHDTAAAVNSHPVPEASEDSDGDSAFGSPRWALQLPLWARACSAKPH